MTSRTSCGDKRVVALARIDGKSRVAGKKTGSPATDTWIVREGAPIRFDECIDPLRTPLAARAPRG